MADERFLHHVNQLVVAFRVGRQEEEAGIDKIAEGVMHQTLHHFSTAKFEPHPDSVDGGLVRMKIEIFVFRLSVKTIHVVKSRDVFTRNNLNNICSEIPDAEETGRAVGGLPQQLFHRVPSWVIHVALEDRSTGTNHHLFQSPRIQLILTLGQATSVTSISYFL